MTPNALDHVSTVGEAQVAFGNRLGIDLSGKSVGVARAMIEDVIERDFSGETNLGSPTAKQISLAAKFGFDISPMTRRVGNAVIDDIMFQLNKDAICSEGLRPGVEVINKHDIFRRRMVISSIADDGTVYFRGGNGMKAWARSLIHAESLASSEVTGYAGV